jgi:hypothetical protein
MSHLCLSSWVYWCILRRIGHVCTIIAFAYTKRHDDSEYVGARAPTSVHHEEQHLILIWNHGGWRYDSVMESRRCPCYRPAHVNAWCAPHLNLFFSSEFPIMFLCFATLGCIEIICGAFFQNLRRCHAPSTSVRVSGEAYATDSCSSSSPQRIVHLCLFSASCTFCMVHSLSQPLF